MDVTPARYFKTKQQSRTHRITKSVSRYAKTSPTELNMSKSIKKVYNSNVYAEKQKKNRTNLNHSSLVEFMKTKYGKNVPGVIEGKGLHLSTPKAPQHQLNSLHAHSIKTRTRYDHLSINLPSLKDIQ
jgi:hypothetical protein